MEELAAAIGVAEAAKAGELDYFETNNNEAPKQSEQGSHHLLQYQQCTTKENYLKSYGAATVLALLYVASLYIWKTKHASTHPETIKRRFVSVTIVTILAPFYVNFFINQDLLKEHTLAEILGLRLPGLINAIVLPLILTGILFLGPTSMEIFSGLLNIYLQPMYWLNYMKELIWVRNYVVAPITEEFVFRACILSLILPCVEPIKAVFICPIFFGSAHLHHFFEQLRRGIKWKFALFTSLFQFLYTSIFGAFSAYLFLRTGHVIAPMVVHSFCNHMGFPDFGALAEMPRKQKLISTTCFIIGVCGWIFLLKPLTDPKLFSNNLPWSKHI